MDVDVDPDTTPLSTATTSSTFRKTVTLYDWWLIKSEKDYNGRILAVGGSTTEGNSAIRILSSAPVVKRYDMVTLETADRMRIILKGYINRTRTHENGFSSEVYGRLFLNGFPSIWEHFSYQCEEGINVKNIFGGWDEKGGESKRNLSKEISEDPLAAPVSQVTAKNLVPSDIELPKTENTSNESKVGREVVSENLMNNPSDCSSKLSFNSINSLEDHLVRTDSSVSMLKVDKDNYGEKASPYMRSRERAKYLNSRLKEIHNSKMKSSNLCDSVLQDNVNDVVSPVGKRSCAAKSSSLYNVDIVGTTPKVILPSPSDNPEVFVTSLSCSNDTARKNVSKDSLLCSDVNSLRSSEETKVSLEEKNDASKDSLIELGSDVSDCNPYEVNMVSSVEAPSMPLKSFSRKSPSEKSGGDYSARYNSPKDCFTSCANNNIEKESMGPFEARSSSKLMTMKRGDDNQQRTTRKTTEARRSTRLMNMTKGSDNRQEAIGKKSVLEHPNNGPHSKTRKRLEYMTDTKATPVVKNKKNESSVLSPEKSNYKRTKSGRLRVPPLPFWNNQRIIYDRNLQIAGILNGLPAESPTVSGSDSNPMRKKPTKRI